MDLNTYNLVGAPSARWAKITAFVCFAVACGLLIFSLASTHAAGHPAMHLSKLPSPG